MKTFVLMAVLTALLVVIGSLLGGRTGMFIAFAFAVAMNFFSYWFSDKIVLRMYGAQEVTEAEAPELYQIVGSLAHQENLPMPKIYVIPREQPNAFATGRNPQNAAVAVTHGIMRMLSREELRGVIAHELSHVKHRDILIGTIAATMAGAISMIAHMAQWAMIFGGSRSNDDERGNPIGALAMIIVAPIAAMLIQLAISRSREFLADAGAARMTGNPIALAGALKRLHSTAQQIPMNATPATAHMFIVAPFSGGGVLKLFSTHPPIEERVARLEDIAVGRR
jgi:heat shock protein HtpX